MILTTLQRALLAWLMLLPAAFSAEPVSRKSSLHFHPTVVTEHPLLQKRIYFWKKVFSWYGPNTVILHNTRYPWIVYKVIQLPESLSQIRREPVKHAWWERRLRYEIRKQHWLIYQVATKLQAGQSNWTPEEGRLLQKFRGLSPEDIIYSARRSQFRVQRGMKNDFERALARAARLLPEMEATFRTYGVPPELARLPLIESMFNASARSHVGAFGLWQFMPATAREYGLVVEDYGRDDRTHPVKSTIAAARFLKDYFRSLRAWPLAITAYNHGIRGVRNAIRTTQSQDIVTLIQDYKGPAFGFASQNFYAEFMAALELEKFTDQYFWNAPQKNLVLAN